MPGRRYEKCGVVVFDMIQFVLFFLNVDEDTTEVEDLSSGNV
jgi:hypothetical protein